MKSLVSRIPPKLLLVIGGITVLGGGSGAAAVYVGADRLLGSSFSDANGLQCTTVATFTIRRADRTWIRKYVTTDRPGDGIARLKTALRVAHKVHDAEKADLVQVTVLDRAGPTERAGMRGRAIGAQVVYIPDLDKVPEGAASQSINAYYVDGASDEAGKFWGLRIDLPQEDAEAIAAGLHDTADCVDPNAPVPDAKAAASAHGAEPASHDGATEQDAAPLHKAEAEGDAAGAGFMSGVASMLPAMLGGEAGDPAAEIAEDGESGEIHAAVAEDDNPAPHRAGDAAGETWLATLRGEEDAKSEPSSGH